RPRLGADAAHVLQRGARVLTDDPGVPVWTHAEGHGHEDADARAGVLSGDRRGAERPDRGRDARRRDRARARVTGPTGPGRESHPQRRTRLLRDAGLAQAGARDGHDTAERQAALIRIPNETRPVVRFARVSERDFQTNARRKLTCRAAAPRDRAGVRPRDPPAPARRPRSSRSTRRAATPFPPPPGTRSAAPTAAPSRRRPRAPPS